MQKFLDSPHGVARDKVIRHQLPKASHERIYIGRCFKNDTERLEKLFELYTKMTANAPAKQAGKKR